MKRIVISDSLHAQVKQEAQKRGMKMYALAEKALLKELELPADKIFEQNVACMQASPENEK